MTDKLSHSQKQLRPIHPTHKKRYKPTKYLKLLIKIDLSYLKQLVIMADLEEYFNPSLDAMYSFPAKKSLALLHRNASRFSYVGPRDSETPHPIKNMKCPCCGDYIFNQQFPLCYKTSPADPKEKQQIFLLPAGVSIYFKFIKIVIFYLLLRFLIVDVYIIYWSNYGSFCSNLFQSNHKDLCLFITSAVNLKTLTDQNRLNDLDWLSFLFTIVSMVFFYFSRKNILKYYSWMDNCQDVSQENYSILLQNIPLIYEYTQSNQQTYKQIIERPIKAKLEEWMEEIRNKAKKVQAEKLNPKETISIVQTHLLILINKSITTFLEKLKYQVLYLMIWLQINQKWLFW